jgi:hypothetical protein
MRQGRPRRDGDVRDAVAVAAAAVTIAAAADIDIDVVAATAVAATAVAAAAVTIAAATLSNNGPAATTLSDNGPPAVAATTITIAAATRCCRVHLLSDGLKLCGQCRSHRNCACAARLSRMR